MLGEIRCAQDSMSSLTCPRDQVSTTIYINKTIIYVPRSTINIPYQLQHKMVIFSSDGSCHNITQPIPFTPFLKNWGVDGITEPIGLDDFGPPLPFPPLPLDPICIWSWCFGHESGWAFLNASHIAHWNLDFHVACGWPRDALFKTQWVYVIAQKGYEFELCHTTYAYATQIVACSYVHVWRASRKYTTFVFVW